MHRLNKLKNLIFVSLLLICISFQANAFTITDWKVVYDCTPNLYLKFPELSESLEFRLIDPDGLQVGWDYVTAGESKAELFMAGLWETPKPGKYTLIVEDFLGKEVYRRTFEFEGAKLSVKVNFTWEPRYYYYILEYINLYIRTDGDLPAYITTAEVDVGGERDTILVYDSIPPGRDKSIREWTYITLPTKDVDYTVILKDSKRMLLVYSTQTLKEALDSELEFTTGGNSSWFPQTSTYYFDGDAAESGGISDDESTWIKTSVKGPGIISFYWRVDSEAGDYLSFYIDGVLRARISGNTSWEQKIYEVGPGLHELKWVYAKDFAGSYGEDCGWIDRVEFVSLAEKEISIGVLVDLSGPLTTYGMDIKNALEIAKEDINNYFAEKDLPYRVELYVEETKADPKITLDKVQMLYGKGINLIVGPMGSGEVKNIKEFVTANKIVMISPSSTALPEIIGFTKPEEKKYIFRFVGTDDLQTDAIAGELRDLGIKAVVITYIGNAWGKGLYECIKPKLEKAGIEIKDAIEYPDPPPADFSSYIATMESDVNELLKEYSQAEVAIVAFSFEEVANIIAQTSDESVLFNVLWIGCDGAAKSGKILEVCDKAKRVGIYSTLFESKGEAFEELRAKYKERGFGEPYQFAMNAYDAAWVIALAYVEVVEEKGSYDADAMAEKIPEVTEDYSKGVYGVEPVTGYITLNEWNDRASGDYAIYYVTDCSWDTAGIWRSAVNKVEWVKKPTVPSPMPTPTPTSTPIPIPTPVPTPVPIVQKVVRDLPSMVQPSQEFNVTLTFKELYLGSYAREVFPIEFSFVEAYYDPNIVNVTVFRNQITITPLEAAGEIPASYKVVYRLRAPITEGTYTFTAYWENLFTGESGSIGGIKSITVTELTKEKIKQQIIGLILEYIGAPPEERQLIRQQIVQLILQYISS